MANLEFEKASGSRSEATQNIGSPAQTAGLRGLLGGSVGAGPGLLLGRAPTMLRKEGTIKTGTIDGQAGMMFRSSQSRRTPANQPALAPTGLPRRLGSRPAG